MKLGDSYSINNGYELRWMTKNELFKLRNELAENPFLHINDIRQMISFLRMKGRKLTT